MNRRLSFMAILALAAITFAPLCGDEIVLDRSQESVSIGGFECSNCAIPVKNRIALDENTTVVTAGELWKFFDRQGIESLDDLTLCIDLEPGLGAKEFVDIDSFEFMIEGDNGEVLTHVSLGENKLVVPEHEITTSKPEAVIKIGLDYNFMERFTSESSELVSVKLSSSDAEASPTLMVAGVNDFIPSKASVLFLIGFVAFWGMVFIALNRFTKPQQELVSELAEGVLKSDSRQALSA